MGDTFAILALHKQTKTLVVFRNVFLKIDMPNLSFMITSKHMGTDVFPISLFKQYKIISGGTLVTIHGLEGNEKNISLMKFEFRENDPAMDQLAECLNMMVQQNKAINGPNIPEIKQKRVNVHPTVEPKRACSWISTKAVNSSPSHVVCYESEEHQQKMIANQKCSLDSRTFLTECVRLHRKKCLVFMKKAELVVDMANKKLSIYHKRCEEIVYPINIFCQHRVRAEGEFVELCGVENNARKIEHVIFEFPADDPQIIELTKVLNKLFQKIRGRENENVDEEGTSEPKRKIHKNNNNDDVVTLDI